MGRSNGPVLAYKLVGRFAWEFAAKSIRTGGDRVCQENASVPTQSLAMDFRLFLYIRETVNS